MLLALNSFNGELVFERKMIEFGFKLPELVDVRHTERQKSD